MNSIPQGEDLIISVGTDDHSSGPSHAAVTLVEYGDYQCPSCGEAYWILKDVLRHVAGVRFVFRNFPLTTVHPWAERAAEAAEAAEAQGHFWKMHDVLFENQDALDDQSLVDYAARLGLDQQRFVEDLQKGAYRARIQHDFIGGVRSGVNGTPTFFINGYRYAGAYDQAAIAQALSEFL